MLLSAAGASLAVMPAAFPLVVTAAAALLTAGSVLPAGSVPLASAAAPDHRAVESRSSGRAAGGSTAAAAIAAGAGALPQGAARAPALARGTAGAGSLPPDAAGAALLGAAAPVPAGTRASETLWRWPLLVTPRVVRRFEPPARDWMPGHRGVDLAAVPGDTVVAAGDGIITFAGPLAGRGVVTVTHANGLRTTYEPVTAGVTVGEHVEAGATIGHLGTGASHCGGYPSCLHWGLRRGDTYLDPLLLLGIGHPVLLPIPTGR